MYLFTFIVIVICLTCIICSKLARWIYRDHFSRTKKSKIQL